MGQRVWHGLSYYDVIGNESRLTYREMWSIVRHPQTVLFVSLAVLVLILLDAHNYRTSMSVSSTVILWVGCGFTLVGFYIAITTICMLVSQKFRGFKVYFPLVGFLSMAMNTYVTIFVATRLSRSSFSPSEVIEHLPTNLALGLIFESLFTVFVLPKMRVSLEGKSGVKLSTVPEVIIAGKRFELGKIISISSQDHYVEVVTAASKQLIRARLADITPQISEEIGIVPHRSHWVARSAVEQFDDKTQPKVLALNNGSKIPVARGRVKDVRNWLNQ